MSTEEWKSLYETIEVRTEPDCTIAPKPTEQQLDQFELVADFKLPKSYRDFIRVFGAGELACEYKIMAPGYLNPTGSQGVPVYDLQSFNDSTKNQFDTTFLSFFSDPEKIQRLVYFCATGTGNIIGWDPQDIREARQYDYGIYELGRSETLEFLADSFRAFIEEVCLSEANLHPPGWNEERHGSRRGFDPAWDNSP